VRRFDLQRRRVVGEDGADLERTFLFVKNVHAGDRRRRRKKDAAGKAASGL
jgi:hypothetical protein